MKVHPEFDHMIARHKKNIIKKQQAGIRPGDKTNTNNRNLKKKNEEEKKKEEEVIHTTYFCLFLA